MKKIDPPIVHNGRDGISSFLHRSVDLGVSGMKKTVAFCRELHSAVYLTLLHLFLPIYYAIVGYRRHDDALMGIAIYAGIMVMCVAILMYLVTMLRKLNHKVLKRNQDMANLLVSVGYEEIYKSLKRGSYQEKARWN